MLARTPLELLAAELGSSVGQIERELGLQVAAAISDLKRADAERELRIVRLEALLQEKLASVKDGDKGETGPAGESIKGDPGPPGESVKGDPGPPGDPGKSVTIEDVEPIIARHVAVVAAQIPRPKDGADADPAVIREIVDEAVAKIPPAAPGKDADPALIADMVSREIAKLPKPLDGADADPAVIREMVSAAVAEIPRPKDGERGPEGAPGKLAKVKAWVEGVHYEGDVVAHVGATYQASRDTGKEPPHADWLCLASAGRDGAEGRSFKIRSTWKPEETYFALDVVAMNFGSFIARRDNPGPCPGDGWQGIAAQGKTGKTGDRGERGLKGDTGPSGPSVVAAQIDAQGLLTLVNGDGSTVTCDFYPLLTKIVR